MNNVAIQILQNLAQNIALTSFCIILDLLSMVIPHEVNSRSINMDLFICKLYVLSHHSTSVKGVLLFRKRDPLKQEVPQKLACALAYFYLFSLKVTVEITGNSDHDIYINMDQRFIFSLRSGDVRDDTMRKRAFRYKSQIQLRLDGDALLHISFHESSPFASIQIPAPTV